ncbi:PTS transporter subunit EIIC [Enterobacter hormaechei]
MLPISLLPAAGLLLAFGDKFHLPLMMNAGGVIFDNLPMLFAIGSAVGLASESGIAALSAAVSVFVTNITISTVLSITPEMASQGGKYAMVVGIPTLQMGVFGGLICGILAAWCYEPLPHHAAAGIPRLLLRQALCGDCDGVSVVPARPAAAVRLAAYSVRHRRPVRGGERR